MRTEQRPEGARAEARRPRRLTPAFDVHQGFVTTCLFGLILPTP